MKQQDMMNNLDKIYGLVVDGIPHVAEPVTQLADKYVRKSRSVDEAAVKLINAQIAKSTASGFVTGLGGILTIPVSLPANLATVLYFQLRMIAGVAYMAGYDVHSPQVRSLAYVCLAGLTMEQLLKNTGIKVGTRITKSVASKLPGKLTASINQKVGYRLFTKFGNRSALSVGKAVPILGGVISGGIDMLETQMIAERAYNMFIGGEGEHAADFTDFEVLDEE
ncbi:MAG: EcsC family protein [Oscillospiraceae bacterium]|nr:EcsC family protein [Oscillospiraceae bacterium]